MEVIRSDETASKIGWQPCLEGKRQGKHRVGATRYTPGIGHVIEEVTETPQICSYDPDGTSYQNTREVIAKWGCVNVRGREPERQSADGHAEPRYEVRLFFRESPVPFLIERYDGM